jgi:ferritin
MRRKIVMVNQKVQEKLNEQIQKELYSAYLYLSMETYFLSEGLDGFANWFHVQAQEERDHAMLIFNYLNRIGGRIELRQIDAPPVEFESICHVLKQTLEHEQMVTQSIYDIVDVAAEVRDHKTSAFLQWFVNEQVEEEENAEKNLRDYELIEGDGKGTMMLDRELGARVYVPTVS